MPTLQDVIALALSHLRAARPQEAEALCRPLLEMIPLEPAVPYLLALARQQTGDGPAMAALLRRTITLDPAFEGADTYLGMLLHRLGRTAEARPILERAVVRSPHLSEAQYGLGQVLLAQDEPAAAADCFRKAIDLRPDPVEALFYLGVARHADGRSRAAEAAYGAALLVDPTRFETYVNLGNLHWHRHALDRAIVLYRRAARLNPGHAMVHTRLALSLMSAGQPAAAAAAFRVCLSLSPKDPEAQSGLQRSQGYLSLLRAAGDPAAPGGLAVRGVFRDASGYATMVRRFTHHLAGAGVAVHLSDVRAASMVLLPHHQRDATLERLDRPVRAKAMLNFVTPMMMEPAPSLASALFSMFEGRRIPEDWSACSATQDLLIVPTESSRQAWIAGGMPEDRIRICPLGVTPVPDHGALPPMNLMDETGRRLSDHRTRILNVSDFAVRKNLDGLLRVWMRATTPADDAVLILKPGKLLRREDPTFPHFIRLAARSVGKTPEEAAPILCVYGRYSDEAMLSLFAAATHYWSMSHAEGWDLPMTQAGAMGLRLIAPDHSAYQAYLDAGVASLIPARESRALDGYGRVPIPGYYPPLWMCREQEWWDPDEDAAVELVARAVRGEDPALSARDRLLGAYGWDRAAERLCGVLADAGMMPGD